MSESPRCVCGHRKYDHPYSARCDAGNRQCRCVGFQEDKGDNK